MGHFTCSMLELMLVYIDSDKNISCVEQFVRERSQLKDENIQYIVNKIQKSLIPHFNDRWKKSQRKKERFLEKNAEWLNGEYSINVPISVKALSVSKRGRPLLSYENSAESSRKRKNTLLIQDTGLEHIQSAYTQGLRSIGEVEEAKIINLIRSMSKSKKKDLLESLEEHEDEKSLDEVEALSVLLDLDLTKNQYKHLRSILLDRKCHILPSYSKVQEAKLSCYPPLTSIEVENTSAKVKNLQDLLDHTTRRILMIESVCCKDLLDLVLYCKWGSDESSGQSEYCYKSCI